MFPDRMRMQILSKVHGSHSSLVNDTTIWNIGLELFGKKTSFDHFHVERFQIIGIHSHDINDRKIVAFLSPIPTEIIAGDGTLFDVGRCNVFYNISIFQVSFF